MTAHQVCSDCPFLIAGADRDRLMERMNQGAWIACRHTAAPTVAMMSHRDRIRAWAAEQECVAARAWRRDRVTPPAAPASIIDRPDDYVVANPRAWVDLLRGQIAELGWTEIARRSGLNKSIYGSFNASGKVPTLQTLIKVTAALGIDLVARRRVQR